MADQTDKELYFGSLIAVEGDEDVISTQLRLLPSSSKILVLPPLTNDLETPQNDDPFNPRAFVREVHNRLSSRSYIALSFLRDSTIDQPRLVFMNGGSICARTTCIATISEKLTDGEIRQAEELFENIIKDGVTGLMMDEEADAAYEDNEDDTDDLDDQSNKALHMDEEQDLDGIEEAAEDPSVVAMKAADTLDHDTAALQFSDEEELEYDKILSLAGNAPVPAVDAQEAAEVADAMFANADGALTRKTIITMPTTFSVLNETRRSFGGFGPHCTDSCMDDGGYESDFDDHGLLSPISRSSAPPTPGAVEFGEACIVDVGTSPIRRVKSLDRFSTQRSNAASLQASPRMLRQAASIQNFKSVTSLDNDRSSCYSDNFQRLETLPRKTFVRASKTVIRKTPPVSRQSSFADSPLVEDDGSNEQALQSPEMSDAFTQFPDEIGQEMQFEPVFPIFEDLVIHFEGGATKEIIEAVIQAYQDGSYPILPSAPVDCVAPLSSPPSPSHVERSSNVRPYSHMTVETDDEGYHRRLEVDPFNPNSYAADNKILWPQESSKNLALVTSKVEPPTPSTTPPPMVSEWSQKFQKFSPINATTAINVQNSFRTILNMHFPTETTNYRQLTYPDDSDRFWKPVFRNDYGMEGMSVDQIIAIGCEDRVKKSYFDDVVGQVGKLGTLKSGISRTGKLDIRYLITTAMQAYNAQPAAIQTGDPLSDPTCLASLLVPQLETYLSTNDSTRLLVLTYPASHLATVLTLQKLLGSDTLKVAGIMDSSCGNLSSGLPSKSTTTTTPNFLSNEGAAGLNARHQSKSFINRTHISSSPTPHSPSSSIAKHDGSRSGSTNSLHSIKPSFAKANYVLPSTATAAEVSTFLTAIRTTLISISPFYTPEPEPQVLVAPPIPPIPTSKFAEPTTRPRSPKNPSAAKKSFDGGKLKSGHHYAKSTASARERKDLKEWENFYIGGDDSEDEDARRLMPRMATPDMRKGNSRKALKFLGLA